jgi:hypothetical protein
MYPPKQFRVSNENDSVMVDYDSIPFAVEPERG